MSEDHNLTKIDLAGISEPAKVLIEKISDAIGGAFRPFQIRRIAKAEADAALIDAETEVKITDLQRRAVHRWLNEEGVRQANIESITVKALPGVSPNARPTEIANDWIANFFEKCRVVSDEQMQSMWGKILADEANSPGRFTSRTVNVLASLSKYDARQFTNLCSFGVNFGTLFPLVYDPELKIYNDAGINLRTLTSLEEAGLVRFSGAEDYLLTLEESSYTGLATSITAQYFERLLKLEPPVQSLRAPELVKLERQPEVFYTHGLRRLLPHESRSITRQANDGRMKSQLNIGKATFTDAGTQLAMLSSATPREGFVEFLVNTWTQMGVQVTEIKRDNIVFLRDSFDIEKAIIDRSRKGGRKNPGHP